MRPRVCSATIVRISHAETRRRIGHQLHQSARLYFHGDYAQSVAYADKAFAAQPDDNARISRAFYVAQSLNKLGHAARAETLLREAIEKLKRTERAFELSAFKSALGESLMLQRRFAEAETNLREAYQMQKARVLPEQYDFVQTRRRLAELYCAWGKADEAQKYE